MSGMHQPVSESLLTVNSANESTLHAIDPEDVSLSGEGLRRVLPIAREMIRRFMPGMDPEKASMSQIMSLFADQAYWDENSGGLLLCADLADRALCLPVPRKHWRVRVEGVVYH
ncbi:hypothetical protein [Pseudodesulfovibrio sp.]|uniref:hypothetical protein n=1 Tax=unclassified Pseudodesulfovibrio TaxID=2661612 RepID=UPI003B00CF74